MTTVTSLYRYPVKSMQGLEVPALDLAADGVRRTTAGGRWSTWRPGS